jgi:hypothetical protein
MRCRREWRKCLVKTSAPGGVGAGASIARPIYRIVGLCVSVLPVRYTARLACHRAYVLPRRCIASLAIKCGSNCRPTFGGSGGWLTARTCGVGPRVGTFKTDFTPPAAATISRARASLGRRKIRGSRRGGVLLYVCEFGAVRRYFLQRTTVKGPQ